MSNFTYKPNKGQYFLQDIPEKVFFTSDTHFNHFNIIKYCNRPFSSKEEMNKALIANWNSRVSGDSHVFHLGDFAFGDVSESNSIRHQLNGIIHFVFGNHDSVARQMKWKLDDTFDNYIELKIKNYPMIVLSHYAFEVWNKSHVGSWHMYGHSHGSLPDNPNAKKFDVGVDCFNYAPVNILEVEKIMNTKTFVPIDHHGE